MILRSNLPRVFDLASQASRVLDVGGWWCPLNLATHVLDLMPFETRRRHDAIDPEHAERFDSGSWIVWDACDAPWPFPDKFFDFSFCSHTLEDLRDPVTVTRELSRVSRAGYIETPSRLREIFVKERLAALRRGAPIGFPHHRWFVEGNETHLRFIAKDLRVAMCRQHYIVRGDIGRKLTEKESGLGLFWHDGISAEEIMETPSGLAQFRKTALATIKS